MVVHASFRLIDLDKSQPYRRNATQTQVQVLKQELSFKNSLLDVILVTSSFSANQVAGKLPT